MACAQPGSLDSLLHEVELSAGDDGRGERHLRGVGELGDHGHVALRLLVLGCGFCSTRVKVNEERYLGYGRRQGEGRGGALLGD